MCEAQRAQNEKTTVRQNCGTCTRGTSSTALDPGCGLAVIGNDHADIEETDKNKDGRVEWWREVREVQ